jgi:4-hydroxybenzoate polyprenyltransferase
VTTERAEPVRPTRAPVPIALLGAAHPGPAFAVTVLSALLATAVDLSAARIALVVAAVLSGQLSIGWSNDLVDLRRDRAVARADKPLATGAVSERVARAACMSAAVATVPLSLLCGWVAGAVHLACVACGWAYNLGLKSTPWSWAPYAVAFGGLPVFVSLSAEPHDLPPVWLPVAGALLGVGAHFVNVLPDLGDDEATGVRGLPHRLGARWSQVVAAVVLVAATVVIVVGAPVESTAVAVVALTLSGGLGLVALLSSGRTPFLAAIAMALVDVVMLVWAR